MVTANFSPDAIESILHEARKVNREIGDYQEHSCTARDYNYFIRLSNGVIQLYAEEIQYADKLPKERWTDIAARFRKK
jgi:hypothetical protein